jgi:hypothetical protein
MRLSGASLRQAIPGNGFRTVASGAQKGFVEDRNNSSQRAPRDFKGKKAAPGSGHSAKIHCNATGRPDNQRKKGMAL